MSHASSVALVGDSGYLRGASVIALWELCPTNPSLVYVGAKGRVRRKLPRGILLVDCRPCETTIYEGICCQPLFAYRKVHAWPPRVEKGEIWEEVYRAQSLDLNVLPTVDEAIAWANDLIAKIDQA